MTFHAWYMHTAAEFPIAAAGAQASIVMPSQMIESMTSLNLSFFAAMRFPSPGLGLTSFTCHCVPPSVGGGFIGV